MFLDSLPVELQLAIVRLLDRDGLKNLRCTNKSSCSITSAQLFEVIHISPNTRSFDRARHVATSVHLSSLVKSLIYHVAVLDDVQDGFESFRVRVLRLDPTNDVTEDMIWRYSCFLEEIDGQRDFETRDEDEELRDLCEGFTNLEAIATVLDEYDDPFAPPEDFVGIRTGAHSVHAVEGTHLSSLYKAAAGKNLQRISALAASWPCLLRIYYPVQESQKMLSRIKDLQIGLDNSEYLGLMHEDQDDNLLVLQDIFTAARNLQNLHVDFDEIPFETDAQNLLNISHCLFSHSWPSLIKLDLMGVAATEEGFVNFLQQHSQSLCHLHLDDIEIVAEMRASDSDAMPLSGSILSLFDRISQTLTLKSATLTGNFSNRHDEAWYVDTENNWPDSLVSQLEAWLAGKSKSPLPPGILNRRREPLSDTENVDDTSDISSEDDVEDDGLPQPEDWFDESWVWCPELMW